LDEAGIGDFISFLRKIRDTNPEKRIVVILDNFRTHHAKKVGEEAEKLHIWAYLLGDKFKMLCTYHKRVALLNENHFPDDEQFKIQRIKDDF